MPKVQGRVSSRLTFCTENKKNELVGSDPTKQSETLNEENRFHFRKLKRNLFNRKKKKTEPAHGPYLDNARRFGQRLIPKRVMSNVR